MHTFLLVAALGLASAAPTDPGCIPRYSVSKGFRLVVNVTDPSKDFSPSLQNSFLSLAHIGPPNTRAFTTTNPGPIFYQNGTTSDPSLTNTLTDAGTPPFPMGITYLREPTDAQGQGIYGIGGPGSQAVKMTPLSAPYSYLTILNEVTASSFIVCNATIPYYGNQRFFNIVNWVTSTRDATGTHLVIPQGCVPVNLIPQCAVLDPLPEGAIASHDFAMDVRCYDDVSGIDWAKYSY